MDPIILHANTYRFAPGEEIRSGPVASRMQLWCLSGRGEAAVDGRRCALEPGRVQLLPWGFRVRYRADRRRPCVLAGIHLIPDAAALDPMPFSQVPHAGSRISGLEPSDDPSCTGLHELAWAGHEAWRSLSDYALACFTRAAPVAAEQRRLARQLVEEWRHVLAAVGDDDPAWVRIAARVAADPARRWSLAELAVLAGCATATLSRRVRARFGCSPTIWIQRLKVDLAKARLIETELTLAAIADELGMCDAFYLSRIFTRHAGMSPSAWRQRRAAL